MAEYLQRHLSPFFFMVVATTSLLAGTMVARGGPLTGLLLTGLVVLGGLWVLFSIPPQTLFLGWLFLAPIFQNGADGTAIGAPLALALYAAPGAMLAVLTILQRRRDVRLTATDFLPAGFLAYVLAVMLSTSEALQATPKFTFGTVLLGPVVYYFLRAGPGAGIPREKIVSTLMYTAVLQGAMSIVDLMTGWNLWGETDWQTGVHSSFPRAVATLSNPAVLGTFLGVAIVASVAILSWDGPRTLRRPAFLTLAVCIPGLLATLTRGPILAIALAVILVLAFSRLRLATLSGLLVFAAVLVAIFPTIRATELYEDRVSNRENIAARAALQDWSLQLAAQKPVFGWGYDSFDEAKNAARFDAKGINIVLILDFTSHNTYLTMLVELGAVGLLLFGLPFVVLGVSGVSRVRAAPPADRWLIVTSLASLFVIALSAMTFDLRFFSFAQVLTWVFLAMLASLLAKQQAAPRG